LQAPFELDFVFGQKAFGIIDVGFKSVFLQSLRQQNSLAMSRSYDNLVSLMFSENKLRDCKIFM